MKENPEKGSQCSNLLLNQVVKGTGIDIQAQNIRIVELNKDNI